MLIIKCHSWCKRNPQLKSELWVLFYFRYMHPLIMLPLFALSLKADDKNVLFFFGSFHLENFHSLYKISTTFKNCRKKKEIENQRTDRSKNTYF